MFKCEAANSAMNRAMALEHQGKFVASAKLVEAAVQAELVFLAQAGRPRQFSLRLVHTAEDVS